MKQTMREKIYLSLLIGLLLCLVGWTAHAQLSRSAPARQAWEYKTIVFAGKAGNWQAWAEDGKDLPTPVNGTAKRAELGAQGWELVAVSTNIDSQLEFTDAPHKDFYTHTDGMTQFFKRPK
jgi:hypothetical protein